VLANRNFGNYLGENARRIAEDCLDWSVLGNKLIKMIKTMINGHAGQYI